MIKSLLKLGLFLVAGILVYNYFFGDEAEKEQSQQVFRKVRDLGSDAWNLLKSEKQKLDEGKYEGAVDKVGDAVNSVGDLLGQLRRTAKDLEDSGALDRIDELQQKQKELEHQIEQETPESYDAEEEARVKRELRDLLKETEQLMESMEAEGS